MIELRPYQRASIAELMSSTAIRRILVAPTGSGKTVIAAELIRAAVAEGKRVLFLAHRRELIHQTQAKLADFGIDAGIILAGEPTDPNAMVQVASIQTLWTRAIVRKTGELPRADLIVIDEAHHARARTYRKIIEKYPAATVIGMTATPCRGDGRGLGNIFTAMVECPPVQALIDLGHLVTTKVYAPTTPNLDGVHVRHGDYVERELAARVDTAELVGDIVSHWHRLAERRKTVVFATGVAHSIHLRDEFIKSGVRAEHIDGKTPKDERDDILRRLSSGEIELVTNCMVLVEGWDQPDVSCIVLARPTRQMGLYRQMVGRVLRPHPDKEFALVLDHAGAVFRHGFVEEPVEWFLDTDKRAESPVHASRRQEFGLSQTRLVTCTECSAVRTAGKPCGICGHMPQRRGDHIDVRDGELAHLRRDGTRDPQTFTGEERHLFHQQLVGVAMQKGYKPGWAAHQYKSKFGQWPPFGNVEPIPPSPEVQSWVRSRQIAYAKAMQKVAANA